jgi:hypothetical protein
MRQATTLLSRVRMTAYAAVTMTVSAFAVCGSVSAQSPPTEVIKQVKLSEAHIKGFIAAQADMAKMSEKMQGAAADKPDPKIQSELETIAKNNGFKDFGEYDDVAANISIVMQGIDPQSGNFTDPIASIKKEIDDVTADKTLQEKDKTQMLSELNEALKTTQPIQFPENVELVKKNRVELEKVLQ